MLYPLSYGGVRAILTNLLPACHVQLEGGRFFRDGNGRFAYAGDVIATTTSREAFLIRALACLTVLLTFANPSERQIRIEADDLLRFSQAEVRVSPGTALSIELHNKGRIASMRHNLVILKQGTDINHFGNAAMTAEATGYIPTEMAHLVIAHTGLAGSGETVSARFEAPAEKGRYPFICSVSGHYSVSKGFLIVE